MGKFWFKNIAYLIFSAYGTVAGFAVGTVIGLLIGLPTVAGAPFGSIARILWSIANSMVFMAVTGSLVAAFAATWAARNLANWHAERKHLLAEIRGTKAAIGLALNIANTYLTAKKQYVRDLVARYERQCEEREAYLAGLAEGRIDATVPFQYHIELRTILAPFTLIDSLKQVLTERISPDSQALILLAPLAQSIRDLTDALTQYNGWIEEFKRLPAEADHQRACLYFGTPIAPGCIDDRYPNFMKAIRTQTDDCIAYAMLIADSLKRYGDRLVDQLGLGAPEISVPDFAMADDLLPDMRNFPAWIKGSVSAVEIIKVK